MTSDGKPGGTRIVRSRGTMAHGLLERALLQVADVIKQQASGKSREEVEQEAQRIFHQLVTGPESERNLLYAFQHVAVPRARARIIALQRQANPKFNPDIHLISPDWIREEAYYLLVQLFEEMLARVLLAGYHSLYEQFLGELLQLGVFQIGAFQAKVYRDPARRFERRNPVGYLYAVLESYRGKKPLKEILAAESGAHQLARAAVFMKRLELIGGEESGQFLAQLGAANSATPLTVVPTEAVTPAPASPASSAMTPSVAAVPVAPVRSAVVRPAVVIRPAPVAPAAAIPAETCHTLILTLTSQQVADIKFIADQLGGPAKPGETTLPDRLLVALKHITTYLRKKK